MTAVLAGVTTTLVVSPNAMAGPRDYAFTQGTEIVPDKVVELEDWLGATTPRGDGDSAWEWWLGPVAGLTDHVEASLLAVLAQPADAGLALESLRLSLSYAPWAKNERYVDLVVRGEVGIPVAAGQPTTTWLLVILGTDLGGFNLVANAGGFVAFDESEAGSVTTSTNTYVVYDVGASYELIGRLRIGAELFGQARLGGDDQSTFAGPSVAWRHGRMWLAGTLGFGIGDESAARRARVVLGIAF